MKLFFKIDILDKGCTTLIVPDATGRCLVMGHNEDGPIESKGCMYLVEAKITVTDTTNGFYHPNNYNQNYLIAYF